MYSQPIGSRYGSQSLTAVRWRPMEVPHVSAAAEVSREDRMLPPKRPVPKMANFGILVAEDTVDRLEAIAKAEEESRNALIGSFLSFSVDLFPLLKPLRVQIEAFAKAEECSYEEAVAQLVERGLRVKK